MIKNAEESSKIDKEKKEKIDLKNQADLVCYQNEKQLKEYEDKISLEKKELLLEGIKEIRNLLQNDEFDNENLKNKLEELQKISQSVGEEIASSAKPEVNDEPKTNSDETVIDTDFTDD